MKLELEINDADAFVIETMLSLNRTPGATDLGPLDIKGLVQMLLKDVVVAIKRPSTSEGINMRQVLHSHRYDQWPSLDYQWPSID